MAKARNYNIYSTDQDRLTVLAEEYRGLGRDVLLVPSEGRLTVLALPVTYKKKRDLENKLKANRLARQSYDYDEEDVKDGWGSRRGEE